MLALALGACEKTAPPKVPTLAVPSWYSPEKVPAVAAALARFDQPVATKVLFGKREALRHKFILGVKRGDFADVALVRNEWLGPLVEAGGVRPLSPALAEAVRSRALPAILPAITIGEKVYAGPFDADALVVWYRRDLAEGVGFHPDLDWTTADFVALARSLSEDRPAFAFSALRYANAALTFLPWYFGRGGQVRTGDELALVSDAAAATFDFLQSLVAEKIAPAGVAGLAQNDVFAGLAGGQYALVMGGSWERGMLRRQSRYADRIDCLPVPGEGGHVSTTVIGGWSLVQFANADADAEMLMRAFFAADTQTAKLHENGLLPVRRDLLSDAWFTENRDGPTLRFALEHGHALPLHVGTAVFLDGVATKLAEAFLGQSDH